MTIGIARGGRDWGRGRGRGGAVKTGKVKELSMQIKVASADR